MNSNIALFLILSVCVHSTIHLEFYDSILWRFIQQMKASCDPDEACKDLNVGDKVPDPLDCHNYYLCLTIDGGTAASDSPIPCSDGHYDPEIKECVEGDDCTVISCSGNCTLECTEAFQLVGYPGDCSKYYICLAGGDKVEVSCPDGNLYFDGQDCTDSSASCCNFCKPDCKETNVQIQDPNDCRKYYICVEMGLPGDNLHFTCPDGEIFDAEKGTCVSGSTCTSLCSAASSTSIATSTQSTLITTESITPTTTTEPATTTEGSKCFDQFTCPSVGLFPHCDFCEKSYFQCNVANSQGILTDCSGDTVFNPDPEFPHCLKPADCPYHPPV